METFWTVWRKEKTLSSTGIGTPARSVRSLVSIPTALTRPVYCMAKLVVFAKIHEGDF